MLGHKDEDDERLPRVLESLLGRDISMVACGVTHTMAVSGEERERGRVGGRAGGRGRGRWRE